MAGIDNTDDDLPLLVTEKAGMDVSPGLIWTAPSGTDCTDEMILRTIASGLSLSGDRRVSAIDGLCAIVAKRVIEMKTIDTREALDLLLPTAHLIQRNIRSERVGTGLRPFDMALFELYQALLAANDPIERMRIAMALGDRATHFTGGWSGSRTINRVMSDQERVRYGTNMAARGYSSAKAIADERIKHPEARSVAQAVPGVTRNFGNIVKVLSSLNDGHLEKAREVVN